MLQRLPVILAVTAASYGLPSHAQGQRAERNGEARHAVHAVHAVAGVAATVTLDRIREDVALQD